MRYIIDISPKQSQAIHQYLEKGYYGSLSQFVITAIENQLSLEESDSNLPIPSNPQQEIQKPIVLAGPKFVSNIEKYALANIPDFNTTIESPGFKNLVFASQNMPENQVWLWGQINKIFPVKLGVRILHELLATKQSMELNEFLETVANEAAAVGNKIRSYEEENNKMRSEKISAALPSSDEKSQNRYKFQFMVYLRKDKRMDGAMSLMRFCNVYEEKKNQMIGLTEAGLKFSSISNPVLDENNLDMSLNEEESLFYINHIKKNIKGEYAAIKWMLEKIKDGNNERESLNTEIKKVFGKTWEATEAVINTQRAGITARMTELGLIEKEKDGIYVKYAVSNLGKKLLNFKI